mgnify:CR=1 FL=1
MERLYTIKEIAELLHRTEKTIRGYIGNGLVAYELEKGYLISETHLAEFLESKRFPKK